MESTRAKNRLLRFFLLLAWQSLRYYFYFFGIVINGFLLSYITHHILEMEDRTINLNANLTESETSLVMDLGIPSFDAEPIPGPSWRI